MGSGRCLVALLLLCTMLLPGCPADSGDSGDGATQGTPGPGPANQSSGENGADSHQYENGSQAEEPPPAQGEAGSLPGQRTGESILQEACAGAMDGYPQWVLMDTELVLWENADKTFDFRVSPEEPSTQTASPAGESETLLDMDFVGQEEVSYAVLTDSGWELGIFRLNGLGVPHNSRIFSAKGNFSMVDVSPISREEFIVLFREGSGQPSLSHLYCPGASPCREEGLPGVLGLSGAHKLAASPAGTYFYLLHDGLLGIFNSSSGEQFMEIPLVESVAWAGDSHLVYSTPNGTLALGVDSGEAGVVGMIGPASGVSFAPKGGGRIAYTDSEGAKVLGCSSWERLAFKQGTSTLAFAGENTLMAMTGDGFVFWRFFDSDWTVRLVDSQPGVFATVWKRY